MQEVGVTKNTCAQAVKPVGVLLRRFLECETVNTLIIAAGSGVLDHFEI